MGETEGGRDSGDERQQQRPGRRRRRRAMLAAIVVGLALPVLGGVAALPAAAQGGGQWVARIKGVASQPLPANAAFAVAAETSDDLNMRLADDIARALAAQGFAVVDDVGGGGLQLWFDTEMAAATVGNDPGAATATEVGDPLVDDQMFGGGAAIGDDDRDVVDPLPEASFSFGPGGRPWQGTPYSLTFIVGRPGQPPIWQGAVTTRIAGGDPYDVARQMVPLLVAQIGKTVRAERSFP